MPMLTIATTPTGTISVSKEVLKEILVDLFKKNFKDFNFHNFSFDFSFNNQHLFIHIKLLSSSTNIDKSLVNTMFDLISVKIKSLINVTTEHIVLTIE